MSLPPEPIDILILSNGPGELATWVKPVVHELRQQFGDNREQVRISVVLSPCANASGQEAAIARRYPEVDRVQAAAHFFPFLLRGQTADGWDWRSHGLVIFLGGDQFFPVVIGKRLGYRILVYAEWEARWHRWVDGFAAMNEQVMQQAPARYRSKFTLVGDLMAEAQQLDGAHLHGAEEATARLAAPLMGLLPGSKPMKLSLGVPLALAIAESLQRSLPEVRFIIPVAPTLDLATLAKFADPNQNPIIQKLGWGSGELIQEAETAYLKTPGGVRIDLWCAFPAYEILAQCHLCLTTVGANTAELGALAVPMIVVLPTQQLDVMRAWDGLPGLLANLPGVGTLFATVINGVVVRRMGLRAWPNIWAKREIVPELVGRLQPEAVAAIALDYLTHPEKLHQMRMQLRQVRGDSGAANRLVQLARALVSGGQATQ